MDMKDKFSSLMGGSKLKSLEPDPLPVAEESDELSIEQMDGRYSAMRPANRNLTRMHVILKDGTWRSFQYHFIDVLSTFDGKQFVFIFAGTKHFQITVKGYGPRFGLLYDWLTLHRLPYLREATRDFADKSETVITKIEIVDVTPRDRGE